MKLFEKTEKFFISLSVLLALGTSMAFAGNELAEARETGRIYHRISESDSGINLLPETAFSEETKNYVFGTDYEKAGFAAESLYYVKKADLSAGDTSIEKVSQIMRSISKMKGMEYYSNTRKRWDTLYLDSYRIENPYSTLALEDDLEGSSDGKILYAYQEEHSFGKGVYKIQYSENSKVVLMKMENVTTLAYGIIKAVKPGNLKIAVNVIDDGDGYFVYIGMCADFIQMSILEKKMNKSFQARLDAIFKWITLQF